MLEPGARRGTKHPMRLGIALLRVVIGALFMGHGLQKLMGWFGGYGLDATGGAFEQMGMRPGKAHATAAGVAETGGGALLVAGAATPMAAAMLTGVMTTAVEKVHLQKGVWNQNGGYEYNVVLTAALFAITAAGPGALAVDSRRSGVGWAIGALAAGVGGGLAVAKLGTRPLPEEGTQRFQRTEQPAETPATA
jgi:putative oxidoreductase